MNQTRSSVKVELNAAAFLTRLAVFCFALISATAATAQIGKTNDGTVVFEDMPDQEVIVFSKDVVIKGDVKGALVFGGDLIVEGNVSGDAAVIGGTLRQSDKSLIGGDVIVIGGVYKYDGGKPRRNEDTETLVYAGYEDELRSFAREPSRLLNPSFSVGFVVQRFLSLVFWFVIGLLISLIAPGAVSRAVTRFRMSKMSVFGFGASALVLSLILVVLSVSAFPGFVSGIISIMVFAGIILSFVFGRAVLQVSLGKWITRLVSPDKKLPDAVAILAGSTVLTILLSLPVLWIPVLLGVFVSSIGLVLTVRRAE